MEFAQEVRSPIPQQIASRPEIAAGTRGSKCLGPPGRPRISPLRPLVQTELMVTPVRRVEPVFEAPEMRMYADRAVSFAVWQS